MKLQIKIDGKTYEAEVEILDDDASQADYAPFASTPGMTQSVPAPGAYVPAQAASLSTSDEKQYRSPVTGLVIRVNVKRGQAVQPNDVVMVLEAMKMETSITAHQAGRVKTVNAAPGDPVKLHQVLLELE